ncbi:hypothetical protein DMUE_5405 [Dictyocoela muelleri]|nr:hypothetical protein DMUE_5405 [Dictyocoela muelleri]
MKRKSEVCYDKIFANLRSIAPKAFSDTKSIIIDFEKASYNSLKSFFVNSRLFGCSFNLGQIIWRKVQGLKFTTEVSIKFQTKLQVKMILALSFVPEKDVAFYASKL